MNEPPNLEEIADKAATLLEALPYFQKFRDRVFLVKIGGSLLDDENLMANLTRDLVFLEVVGIEPILVHGGGKAISKSLASKGIKSKFVDGKRVTSPEALEVAREELHGKLSKKFVDLTRHFKGKARRLPAWKFIKAEKKMHRQGNNLLDIGEVGEIQSINLKPLLKMLKNSEMPVISSLAQNIKDSNKILNINADTAAAEIAIALKAEKLIFLSDVQGVLRNQDEPNSLIHSIDKCSAQQLIKENVIKAGMLPKIQSALNATEKGVNKIHMIDGRQKHSLLLEIFTDKGVGTEIKA